MTTPFHLPINSVSTTVALARTGGDPDLVVADGSPFGSTFPLIVVAARASGVVSILEVTGRSGNSLTIAGAIEGTSDVDLMVGDLVEMRPTALAVTEIQAAVHALESGATNLVTSVAGRIGAVVLSTSDVSGLGTAASHPASDFLAPTGNGSGLTGITGSQIAGNIAGNAASIIGSITESQVTGLTTDLGTLTTAVAGKQAAGNYLTALTSDVTASGPGSAAATVVGLQGRSVATTAPTDGYVLTWVNSTSKWTPVVLPLPSVFIASGASHASGLVPDPGSSAGSTRFLREDATFTVPSATVASGTSGRVPFETTGGVLTDSVRFAMTARGTLDLNDTWGNGCIVVGATAAPNISQFAGGNLVAVGASAFQGLSGASHTGNVGVGFKAGGGPFDSTYLSAGSYNTYIGNQTAPSTASANLSYTTALGAFAAPNASHQVMLGTATEIVVCPGGIQVGITDAGTTTTPVGLQVGHNTSGTAGTGFGVTHLFVSQSSTTADQPLGRIVAKWSTTTHATRKGQLDISADDFTGTSRVGVSVGSDGTQALVGFYGATPVAKAAAPTTLSDVITILRNLGLCS